MVTLLALTHDPGESLGLPPAWGSHHRAVSLSDVHDWNSKTVAEFRANEGRVGGVFEGATLVLVHHRGRKSGREYVTPVMGLAHDSEPDVTYVFATMGGAPTNPDWYYNLVAAG